MSAVPQDLAARPRFRIVRPLIAIVIVVAAVAGWRLLHATAAKADAAPADSKSAAAAAPMELAAADVATVQPRALTRELPLSGSLAPLLQTTIKSRVSGELMQVLVREGQSVKRGEVLARIDTRSLQAQFDSQRATLEKARADLALAKLNRDNSRKLLDDHYISQNAYDSANSTYEANAATVRLAEAQLRQAQLSLDFAVVRAPFDGVIASRLAQPGENVANDTSLLTLVDLSHLELQAPAPASEIPSIHPGQLAEFQVDGFGSRQFEGRVTRINPMTETGSRSIMLYMAVENADGALKGGMFAQGALALDRSAPRPAIPLAAVHSEAGVSYVYVYVDGKLQRRNVTTGLQSPQDGLVEVSDGLKDGDIVVVAKLDDIKDGTPAVLRADSSAPVATDAKPASGA